MSPFPLPLSTFYSRKRSDTDAGKAIGIHYYPLSRHEKKEVISKKIRLQPGVFSLSRR